MELLLAMLALSKFVADVYTQKALTAARLRLSSHFSCPSSFCRHSPFGFAGNDMGNLMYMREAEIKHSRLAMLAVMDGHWPNYLTSPLPILPVCQLLSQRVALVRQS
jgi:Chlorophyll A-B binding protein